MGFPVSDSSPMEIVLVDRRSIFLVIRSKPDGQRLLQRRGRPRVSGRGFPDRRMNQERPCHHIASGLGTLCFLNIRNLKRGGEQTPFRSKLAAMLSYL